MQAAHPIAFYDYSGYIISGPNKYADKTLCVQEIVKGERNCVLFIFSLVAFSAFGITTYSTTTSATGSSTDTPTKGGSLGKVSSCTLSHVGPWRPVRPIIVGNRKYCANEHGYKTQSQASALCKSLNARLPLPKSEAEYASFFKQFPYPAWIDITDPVRVKD